MDNLALPDEDASFPPVVNAAQKSPFQYVFSEGFAALLEQHGISLLLTTYQAGKLMAVRAKDGKVSTLLRTFERPMGLALQSDQVAVGTTNAIWFLRNAADIASQLEPRNAHDACFVPRQCHVTGDIAGHEMSWGQISQKELGEVTKPTSSELWVVNTRFSCLCTLHPDYSFVPRWRPRFVTDLTAEDRCHLNGMAMVDGKPKYVTALGESNASQGWRSDKAHGGVLIDVPSHEIIAQGFSMPHSPRWHAGKLWVLNSGEGELQVVDPKSGQRSTVVRLPGYTRGLAFHGRYAFVGLSKIREKKEFGGLPIETSVKALQCGIWAVDLQTGAAAEFMAFEAGCEEVFAVAVLAGIRWPAIIGFKQDTINGIFVVPQ